MESIYLKITEYLLQEDKENAVISTLEALANGDIDIVSLYEKVLTPALTDIASYNHSQEISIWQEHLRTSIVRTIIECCYPYVLKEKTQKYKHKNDKKVIVSCPAGEYHEIGPRMVADFFTLHGYHAIYVGGNTPKEEMLAITNVHQPHYIVLSVSNYYHLVAAKRTIENIKSNYAHSLKIIVGGYAFKRNPNAYLEVGADILLHHFSDIENLEKETFK